MSREQAGCDHWWFYWLARVVCSRCLVTPRELLFDPPPGPQTQVIRWAT